MTNKFRRALIGVFSVTVLFALWSNHQAHASSDHAVSIADQNTAIVVQMNAQGITGFLSPNAGEGVVPMQVSPGCTVDFTMNSPMGDYTPGHGTVTLYLPYHDAGGRLIGDTDTVTDGKSAQAVQANLAALLKADPKNGICK